MIARNESESALAHALLLAGAAAAVAALAASPRIAPAAQESGSRSASAALDFVIRIPVVLRVRAVRQPGVLDVSPEDAIRGYVDVDSAIAVEIASNSRSGFGLRLQAVHPVASAASFRGAATALRAFGREDELSVARVAGDPVITTLRTGARITLAPGTVPGTYPWPVIVTAHPN